MDDKLTDTGVALVEKYADKLIDVASQYSGPAVDLALAVGRVGAAREIVVGAALLGVFGYAAYRMFGIAKKEATAHKDVFLDANPILIIFPGIASVVCGAFAVVGGMKLANVFAWVGMFHPEIYLAAKALGL